MGWKGTFYGKVDLSTTCRCRQLKLNPLSTQINIHRLMTNQMPTLLVQRAPWTRAAVMLLQSLYFSRPPLPTPRAIIPATLAPSVHLKINIPVTVRRGISKRSHEKIEDCEQSKYIDTPKKCVFFNLSTKQANYFRVMWLVAEMEWWRCGTYSLNSVWRLSRSRKHPWILDQFFYKTCHLLELYTLMKAKYSLVQETMRYDVVVINQETFLACEIYLAW